MCKTMESWYWSHVSTATAVGKQQKILSVPSQYKLDKEEKKITQTTAKLYALTCKPKNAT